VDSARTVCSGTMLAAETYDIPDTTARYVTEVR
jgi:hypothetical protein